MTNSITTFAILGAGNRAETYLSRLEKYYPNQFKVVALADPDKAKQEKFKTKYNLNNHMIFDSYEDFIKCERLADVVMITTLDDMHFIPSMDAIKKGYHILLEKPIAITLAETVAIGNEASKHPNQLVAVCHVLRYSWFFQQIKAILDSKELGKIINIQHNENVGYYHFAHSYVRGNWRNHQVAAPFIVAKSCHDMDILLYLLGDKECIRLSSFGSLSHFTHKNYNKEKMAPLCVDCSINKECPYSALSIYKDMLKSMSSDEHRQYMLRNSPYGRCVYASDNDVCDHQVTILEFDEGITATFNLSAFTNTVHRSLKIMCEYGEIRGNELTKEIEVHKFGETNKKIISPENNFFNDSLSGHGGGDDGIIINFMEAIHKQSEFSSTIAKSIESHVMAFGADESRLQNGKVIDIKQHWQDISSLISKKSS